MASCGTVLFHSSSRISNPLTITCTRESDRLILVLGSSKPNDAEASSAMRWSLTQAAQRWSDKIGDFSSKSRHSPIQLLKRSMLGRHILIAALFDVSGNRVAHEVVRLLTQHSANSKLARFGSFPPHHLPNVLQLGTSIQCQFLKPWSPPRACIERVVLSTETLQDCDTLL
jgi:hypothetical protein